MRAAATAIPAMTTTAMPAIIHALGPEDVVSAAGLVVGDGIALVALGDGVMGAADVGDAEVGLGLGLGGSGATYPKVIPPSMG
jgi:hypothetical protein